MRARERERVCERVFGVCLCLCVLVKACVSVRASAVPLCAHLCCTFTVCVRASVMCKYV